MQGLAFWDKAGELLISLCLGCDRANSEGKRMSNSWSLRRILGAKMPSLKLKRPRHSLQPDLTMEEAWNGFVKGLEEDETLAARRLDYQRMSPEQREELKDYLVDIERAAAASENPMRAIRAAAMKVLAAMSMAEAFLSLPDDQKAALEAHFGDTYSMYRVASGGAFCTMAAVVLRFYYSKPKYDDAAKLDWFEYYGAGAKHFVRARLKLLVQVARDPNDTFSQMLADQYSFDAPKPSVNLFDRLRESVLDSPRKMPLDFSKLGELNSSSVVGGEFFEANCPNCKARHAIFTDESHQMNCTCGAVLLIDRDSNGRFCDLRCRH